MLSEYTKWILKFLNDLVIQYRNKNGYGTPIDPCVTKDMLTDLLKETIIPAISENASETINELGKRKLLE